MAAASSSPLEQPPVDVAIIGAGPVGLACAIAARRRGLRAVVLEKGALVNSFLGYPTQLEFFSTPELMEIGDHPFPTLGYKPTREEAIEYYRRVAGAENLDVRLYTRVRGLTGEEGAFVVEAEHRDGPVRLAARYVIGATGFFDVPNKLGVPGEDLPHVTHYFEEPYPYTGQRVVVVGAKNSAAKAALSCVRHGAEVTMVVRRSAISDSVKYWIKPDLENRIEEGRIRALFDTCVTAIRPGEMDVDTPDGPQTLAADFVLAMTGYRPNYALLEALGIGWDEDDAARTPILDDATFETNRRGVYLAGTVCGGLDTSRWFIENGRHHAAVILDDVAERLSVTA